MNRPKSRKFGVGSRSQNYNLKNRGIINVYTFLRACFDGVEIDATKRCVYLTK